jgi:hypothetical protein
MHFAFRRIPRPLPLPSRTHALLCMTHTHARKITDSNFAAKRSRKASGSPLSQKSKFAPPPIQCRCSRDPNVADRLVVKLNDEDHHHTLPGTGTTMYCSQRSTEPLQCICNNVATERAQSSTVRRYYIVSLRTDTPRPRSLCQPSIQ